jgi:hypothetical protein
MENFEKAVISWERLGEVYYRRYPFCKTKEINNKIDYSYCHIAASRNGGLIAFVKKSKRFIIDNTNPLRDSIRIFYQDGTPVRPIKFGNDKDKAIIVLFSFTDEENLILLMSDGKLYDFDIFTSTYQQLIAGSIFSDNPIVEARLFEDKLAILSQNGNFYLINDITKPQPYLFYSISTLSGIDNSFNNYLPCDFIFIPATLTKSGSIELLIPHPKHGILNITDSGEVKYCRHTSFTNFNRNSITDSALSEDLGKILNINISASNQYISFFNDIGNLFVFPVDLDCEASPRHLSMTKLSFKPGSYQIMWCSEDCVIIVHNGTIFLIGPENRLLKMDVVKSNFRQEGSLNTVNLYCIPEIDGVRIFHDENVEFLEKVNDDLYQSIFALSLDPSKKLLEAYRYAEEKRPNCDEEIRKIRHDLPDAVNRLLTAATTQWDISNQLYLVKAAQHGKTFLVKDEFNFNNFVSICRDMRILNNLRTFDPPRLITYEQYRRLDASGVVKRLIKTQNFFLAHEISLYLHLKVRKVYQNWAVAQIKNLPSSLAPTEEIGFYNEIQKKLSEVQGLSYIKLAKKAFKYHKEEIGIKFLENEKSIQTKIPQYVELRKWDKALELSFLTHDSNIIYTVIDKIMISESMETFKQIVCKYKQAEPIVINYLKTHHENLLKEFLEIKRNWEALFFSFIESFFQSNTIDQRRKNLKEARNCLKIMENNKEKDFDFKFYKVYCDDLEKSLMLKRDLLYEEIIKQSDITTFDNSTFDVYKILVKENKPALVDSKNRSLFEVSPKKVAILRIRAFGDCNNIDSVNLIASNLRNSNLSPVNLAEFYMDYKVYDKAVEWIKKITEEDYFDYKLAMLKHME